MQRTLFKLYFFVTTGWFSGRVQARPEPGGHRGKERVGICSEKNPLSFNDVLIEADCSDSV